MSSRSLLTVLAQIPAEQPTEIVREPYEPGPLYDLLLQVSDNTGLARLVDQTVTPLVKVAVILFLALVLTRVARKLIKRFVVRVAEEGMEKLSVLRRGPLADSQVLDIGRVQMRTETIAGVLRSIATFSIWATALVMVLGVFRFNLGPLLASAGIVGIALGFGAQNLVKDFLSGIFMLLEDQYGVGDIVDVGEAAGVVEAVSLRTTRMRDIYGTVWYVPNGEIRRVGNKSQLWARSLLDIGVAYDTDIPFAISVIKQTADELWQDPDWGQLVLEEPEVWGVENFGPSEIVIRLVVKTEPAKQWQVNRELRKRLKAAFDAQGVQIPFPQRTVWLHNVDGEAAGGEQAGGEQAASPSREVASGGTAPGRKAVSGGEGESGGASASSRRRGAN